MLYICQCCHMSMYSQVLASILSISCHYCHILLQTKILYGFILVKKKQRSSRSRKNKKSSSLFLKRQFFPLFQCNLRILYIFILIAFYQSGLYQSVTVNQIVSQSGILSVIQRVILICWNSSSLSKLKSVIVRVLI